MHERIPQRIDHIRYTDQAVTLQGLINTQESAKELLRFNDAILKNSAGIRYHLEFDVDISGNRYVTGQVNSRVMLQCQRCMNDFEITLDCELSIAFVVNEQQAKRAEDSAYDTFWLAPREMLDPRVLLEDELLLALPQIAMHPLCEIGKSCTSEVIFLETDSDKKVFDDEQENCMDDNPFAILQQLKNRH